MDTTTKQGRADWRPLAEALKLYPGIWHDVPPGPMLNPSLVRAGRYVRAFATAAYEVKGWRKGAQRIRYVGEPRSLEPYFMREVTDLGDLDRRIVPAAWLVHGLERPGFTTLAIDLAGPRVGAPLRPADPRFVAIDRDPDEVLA